MPAPVPPSPDRAVQVGAPQLHSPLAGLAGGLLALLPAVAALLIGPPAALAQSESFLLGPGSSVGPATKVKEKNCVTAPDGSVTCDTQLENSPSDTPAKPQFNPFRN